MLRGRFARASMKHHIDVKLHTALAEDLKIPDWLAFINDKSVVKETIQPDIDRLLSDLGIKFWVTREYSPAGAQWSPAEFREGLNRTYRLILRQDYNLPDDLIHQLRLIPAVEDARELTVAQVPLPEHTFALGASLERRRPADLINLPYARALTTGSPEVKIAVLDTGADLEHPELQGKITSGADFVDLTGLDTWNFIGDLYGYLDDPPEDRFVATEPTSAASLPAGVSRWTRASLTDAGSWWCVSLRP
jgi:thermitase